MNCRRRQLLQAGALTACLPRSAWAQLPSSPRSPFGARTTAAEVTAGIDLSGQTALITGCNSGLGYETMRVLALRGAHVLGTARTAKKGRDACESVAGDAEALVLELTDFESIVACGDAVKARGRPLDILICNAGVLLPERERVRGLEKQFVVNHLGHFLLVNRLIGPMLAADEGRVVVVSSVAHWSAPPEGIEFDNLRARGEYDPGRAYGQSKLANGLFSMELARRLKGTSVTSNALHPGVVETNLFRHSLARVSGGGGRRSVEQGAATSCYLASHPSLQGISGRYFEDCNEATPSPQMQDAELAAELWSVSMELTADYLDRDAPQLAAPRAG
jgi:NAD(P)-dependent dehydrogenase (short-subunit alcohol dehydrogenase family)